MNPERFQNAMRDVGILSIPAIANNLGVTPDTIEAWIDGQVPFPAWVENLVNAIERARSAEERARQWERKYRDLRGKLEVVKEVIGSI